MSWLCCRQCLISDWNDRWCSFFCWSTWFVFVFCEEGVLFAVFDVMAQQSSRLNRLLTLLDSILSESFLKTNLFFPLLLLSRTVFLFLIMVLDNALHCFSLTAIFAKLVQRKQQDLLRLDKLEILPKHIRRTWPLSWRRYDSLHALSFVAFDFSAVDLLLLSEEFLFSTVLDFSSVKADKKTSEKNKNARRHVLFKISVF